MTDRVWIRFSESGNNIRKWQHEPFPEGTEYVAALSRTAQAPVDVRKRAQRLSNVAKDFAARFTINDLAEDDDRQRQAVIEQARLLDSALASSDPTPAAEAGGDEVAAQRLAASPLPSSSGTGWRPIETAWVETRPLYASPPPVRAITDEDVGRAAKAVSDEWGKMVAEMSPHMSPGDIARSFVSPGNHRLIRAALEAAGGRG